MASDEFKSSAMQKVRTPVEDALATWSALRVEVAQPHHDDDAANQLIILSRAMGRSSSTGRRRTAFPTSQPAWTGTGRILGSMRMHWYEARGTGPRQGITFRQPIDWMPRLPAMFHEVVAHVVAQVLSLPMTQTMLDAACKATDIGQGELITEHHELLRLKFPRLMVSILDTPEHLSR